MSPSLKTSSVEQLRQGSVFRPVRPRPFACVRNGSTDGPRDANGTDTYVLCEINASSCFGIPDQAPAAIARTVKDRIMQTLSCR